MPSRLCLHLSYRARFQFRSQYLKPRWSQDVSHVWPYLRAREAPLFNGVSQTTKINVLYTEMAFLCLQQTRLRLVCKWTEATCGSTNYFYYGGVPRKGKHIYFEKQIIPHIWGWESTTPSKPEAVRVWIPLTSASPLWVSLFRYSKSWFAAEVSLSFITICTEDICKLCSHSSKRMQVSSFNTHSIFFSSQVSTKISTSKIE